MDIFRYFRTNYTDRHSNTNAYLCALLSRYIYPDNLPPCDNTFDKCFQAKSMSLSASDEFEVVVIPAHPLGVEFAILSNTRLVFVVFRGVDSNKDRYDFVAQSAMLQVPGWNNSRVHSGAYNDLRAVYPTIRNEVTARLGVGKGLYVTGHSYGGVLATLCSFRFQMDDNLVVNGCYTFGAPRAGDSTFFTNYSTRAVGRRTFRWVYKNDWGPQIPDHNPLPPLRPYVHTGRLIFVNYDGSVDEDRPDFETGVLIEGDHNIAKYVTVIHGRLSSRVREDDNVPPYLVKGDLLPGGMFP